MGPQERIRFLFSKLIGQVHDDKKEDVNDIFEQIVQLQREKEDLEVARQYSAASAAQVVGATITGASIYSKLIARLRPKVVIVEEAAEIAEPGLVAAISQSTEHLILIGDHQQVLGHFILLLDFTSISIFDYSCDHPCKITNWSSNSIMMCQ